MNSSDCSTSEVRQSASFAGKDDDSRAFLRRCVSLCVRAEIRAFILGHDLVEQQRGLRLVVALARGESLGEFLGHHVRDDGADRGRAEDLLRLALELRFGQANG